MSERQILITINQPKGWDEEDFDWAVKQVLSNILDRDSYTIQEVSK